MGKKKKKHSVSPQWRAVSHIPAHFIKFLSHPCLVGFDLIEEKTSAWNVSAVEQLVVDAFDLPIKMVTFEQPSLYGRDSHRAVRVQSQGPSHFYSLSVSLLPHFKRWHIKELLVLDCIHLYTHLIICTVRDTRLLDTQRQNPQSQKNSTHICGCTHVEQRITLTTLQLPGWEVLADDIV